MNETIKLLNDTVLPKNFSEGILDEYDLDINPIHCEKLYDVFFTSSAEVLKKCKSEEHPVALKYAVAGSRFVAAYIVEYVEGVDDAGNWTARWTFDENDITDDIEVIDFSSNSDVLSTFKSISAKKYSLGFVDDSSIVSIMITLADQLHKYLDENAVEGEVVGIKADDIFEAKVSVEDGEKVFDVEPVGEIKAIIKDDASIQAA